MANEEVVGVDRKRNRPDLSQLESIRRRTRLVPAAVTPVQVADLVRGIRDHLRGVGLDEFQADVAAMLDADSTATYTSYRRALGACLRQLTEHSPDRSTILVPAFCSSDFRDAVDGAGLTITYYDVDPDTLAADFESLEEALDERTLAVVAVNALGYSSPMPRLADVCEDADVELVETLGYALGSSFRGQALGSFGDYAALNFQQGKPVPVGGGMIASHDPAPRVSDGGRSPVAPNVATLAGYAVASRPPMYALYSAIEARMRQSGHLDRRVTTHPESKLDVVYDPPFQTMSNFQGSVGRRILARHDEHRRHRARTAETYAEALADCPGVSHVRAVDGLENHQHVRYPILVEDSALRDDILQELRGVGVQARIIYDWPPIDESEFSGAAAVQRGILTLPTHPYVDDGDRRQIVETIRSTAVGWSTTSTR